MSAVLLHHNLIGSNISVNLFMGNWLISILMHARGSLQFFFSLEKTTRKQLTSINLVCLIHNSEFECETQTDWFTVEFNISPIITSKLIISNKFLFN